MMFVVYSNEVNKIGGIEMDRITMETKRNQENATIKFYVNGHLKHTHKCLVSEVDEAKTYFIGLLCKTEE